jgi:hypothetical protein
LLVGKGGRPGPFDPARENGNFFFSMLISESSYKFDLYGILDWAAFVYLSDQLLRFCAHDYHCFSPLDFFNGALLVGKSGSPGPFVPARLNLSTSTSDSS